jgi:hypothetical protein
MKKFVRQYDKYTEKSYYVADMIKRHCPNTLLHLFSWIEENLAEYEKIDVRSWFGEMYYIVVEDTRKGYWAIENYRMGFTVDVDKDEIFWTGFDETRPGFGNGGNCFVRSAKWKSLLSKMFTNEVKNKIHWYKNCYPKV